MRESVGETRSLLYQEGFWLGDPIFDRKGLGKVRVSVKLQVFSEEPS